MTEVVEQTEFEKIPREIKYPANYSENNPDTLYEFGNNWIRISNSWSRKSINVLGQDGGLLWALNSKCQYVIYDEYGDGFSNVEEDFKEFTIESIENIDILVHSWLSKVISEHVDFLVEILRLKNTEQ